MLGRRVMDPKHPTPHKFAYPRTLTDAEYDFFNRNTQKLNFAVTPSPSMSPPISIATPTRRLRIGDFSASRNWYYRYPGCGPLSQFAHSELRALSPTAPEDSGPPAPAAPSPRQIRTIKYLNRSQLVENIHPGHPQIRTDLCEQPFCLAGLRRLGPGIRPRLRGVQSAATETRIGAVGL